MVDSQQQAADPSDPAVIVFFGAGGDLTKRKLIPALYHLAEQKLLPDNFAMVGVDRVDYDSAAYCSQLEGEIREFIGEAFSEQRWKELQRKIYYLQGDFKDPAAYTELSELLQKVDTEQGTPGNYLFYLATPPSFFGEIASQLGQAGLTKQENDLWRRLIIEKPFGRDLQSARALIRTLQQFLQEDQIYRIDHYLGKETVQNILAYRFANSTVEPIWNRRYIDHVQITVAESLGVEHRASYYEEAGALRDMVPNHLMAVLSIVAMEPPNSFDANDVRDEQSKVLRAIQSYTPEEVLTNSVRGQYAAGTLAGGTPAPAYRSEPGIAEQSQTETFVALKLMVDSWRWAGVPFYIRTGKRLPGRYTEVVIQYRQAPNTLFRKSRDGRETIAPNQLVLCIQPDEGIDFVFNSKIPGPVTNLETVKMDFKYVDYFGCEPSTGYETLIYDCLIGDPTLFKRADMIEVGWQLVDPILDVWNALPARGFPNYACGTWGPKAAEELLRRDGRYWVIRPV